jgi:hypothetical protein
MVFGSNNQSGTGAFACSVFNLRWLPAALSEWLGSWIETA